MGGKNPQKFHTFIKSWMGRKLKKSNQQVNIFEPDLWTALDSFFKLYSKIWILPFKFSLEEKKLSRVAIGGWKRALLKSCPFLMVIHTVFCVVILLHNLVKGFDEDNKISHIYEMFCLFYFITIFPSFTLISFITAWRPDTLCNIVNPIYPLSKRIGALGETTSTPERNKLLEFLVTSFVKYIREPESLAKLKVLASGAAPEAGVLASPKLSLSQSESEFFVSPCTAHFLNGISHM
ncbi:hypothetical protein Fcan01_16641 [Folsomia candida]|uniref:Uncharacterized protein n=1 Tax=Folsomia candida TaxID=158441 RepID=A0A226DU87_FOLCA|nr:hypothetical protein Fcan01_16641 [Folsomia candida]